MCGTDTNSSSQRDDRHCIVLTAPLMQNSRTDTPHIPILKPKPKPHTNISLAAVETRSILSISLPMVLTGLILYSRSMISMVFLGRLGDLPLAGGALAIGFANITGYSVLSGLAMGMEPICGQAFGARRHSLLGLALQRTVLLLLSVSLPVALLWLNLRRILLFCGQADDITAVAQCYILYSLPDLLLNSFLHPIRIYLRSQSITMPLTYSAALALLLHLPANYLLVSILQLGVRGVALASVLTNLNLVLLLSAYVYFSGVYQRTGGVAITAETFKGWRSLVNLALPSCISVCLEWWWYEIMILLCGLLLNPRATVASMGVLIQTTSLIYIFPSSLGFGVSTRVGNELGANRPDGARRAAKVGLVMSFTLGLAALTFAFSVRNVWARMFTADTSIIELTSLVLPILGLCELGNCPQTTGCGVLRGSARPRAGANINLGSFYGVGMPVAVALAFWLGLDFIGLWFGLLSAQGTCVILMLGVIRRTDWDVQAERAQELTGANTDQYCDTDPKTSTTKPDVPGDAEDKSSNVLVSIKVDQSTALT
ncbi:protein DETOXIFICATION 49 [Iris pallida]|uniref:Protein DETOXIFICATION n=1 Tax=Iris pallida TaxID=29817 RepID=A0AAX6GMT3_IRIPA|nr:protein DETOXIFICATION 49 [Iris pallida]